MSAAQLVQDHWEFIQRLANDDEEAQQLALRVLDKFEQFKPDRSTFGQFIRLKLRELRQHYSDKGVVGHPCRKESEGYVSLDLRHDDDEAGDDENIEQNLYNLLPEPAAPVRYDLSRLSKQQRRIWELRVAGYSQDEIAEKEGITTARVCQLERAARDSICVDEVSEIYHEETKSRRPAYCEKRGDLGRCPEPTKLKRRRKPVSPEAFRRERIAQESDAPLMSARIYYAERSAGRRSLPKDTLWRTQVPDFLADYWRQKLKEVKPLSEPMTWPRWIKLMKPNRPAWHYECRRVWTALHGEIDFFEPKDGDESWSFAGDAPKSKIKRRAGRGRWRGDLTQWRPWHRLDGPDLWQGLAYLRAYLARNGTAHPLRMRIGPKRSPVSPSEPQKQPDEDNSLLAIAVALLCGRRLRWPPGIPRKRIFPEDKFSPRQRLFNQAMAGLSVPTRWRRPVIRELKYPKNWSGVLAA